MQHSPSLVKSATVSTVIKGISDGLYKGNDNSCNESKFRNNTRNYTGSIKRFSILIL